MLKVKRLVPSRGCDLYLLQTEEKAAVLDTGMFHCAEQTVAVIREALEGRHPDFVLLTHTHYDHVGGIPAIRKAFPGIKVYGSAYAAYVLQRPGARKVMRQLGLEAAKTYIGEDAELDAFDENALCVDEIIGEGDEIDLGSRRLRVYETPGHTTCSLTFYEPEDKILLLSESTGVYVDPTWVDVSILTGYGQTMDSIEKCKALGAETLYVSHYGKISDLSPEAYFTLAKNSAAAFKNLVLKEWGRGCCDEEVMQACREQIWSTKVKGHEDQPVAAFDANTKAFLNVLRKESPNLSEIRD
ncbi:MAG: MBL fold metallo-hydrolase [Eubacteriales bacterium]|jgi:glyoxylase-like metal-dependent hydrolase (beta-lactamase superfamily II)|nr:MBL fold metallo-hydrolase [Eubacteriales bacterium]MDD3863837.1 MBL fold metallo-hydrolase [Eubacteriales bacterium]MDD4444280.1 MBL fold metallo-hydrolase [Eubacteriales bacterium]